MKPTRKHRGAGKREEDARVDEASRESFPASDPPAFNAGRDKDAGPAGRTLHAYRVQKELRPQGLDGLSEDQLAQHWALYEGYVRNVNLLNERLARLAEAREFGPEFSEMKRRLGFEYDGMILHERYFSVLKPGVPPPSPDSELGKALARSFGGFDAWRDEFRAMGSMRGVGWVILYLDPAHQALTNHWIGLHELGHPAGFVPVLVMDCWEHAYAADFGAQGRGKYVEAFLRNVDWSKVAQALWEAGLEKPALRSEP